MQLTSPMSGYPVISLFANNLNTFPGDRLCVSIFLRLWSWNQKKNGQSKSLAIISAICLQHGFKESLRLNFSYVSQRRSGEEGQFSWPGEIRLSGTAGLLWVSWHEGVKTQCEYETKLLNGLIHFAVRTADPSLRTISNGILPAHGSGMWQFRAWVIYKHFHCLKSAQVNPLYHSAWLRLQFHCMVHWPFFFPFMLPHLKKRTSGLFESYKTELKVCSQCLILGSPISVEGAIYGLSFQARLKRSSQETVTYGADRESKQGPW